jgi:hypothetical protein
LINTSWPLVTWSAQNASENLNYLIRLFEKTLDWYKVADAKGQLLLALDGVFITAVTAMIFDEPEDLTRGLAAAGIAGSIILGLSAASIVGSVICAVGCLYSRLSDAKIEGFEQGLAIDTSKLPSYTPKIAGWFGYVATIARLSDGGTAGRTENSFIGYLCRIDSDGEREMLAEQVVALSQKVLTKHRWIDSGWILAGSALFWLVWFAVAYAMGAD